MTHIAAVILDVADPSASDAFHTTAFGLGDRVRTRASDAATTGFRGFTLSLLVSQPANATALFDSAVAAGAIPLKPLAKSMWGFGGVLEAPDGTIWKVATSSKRDSAPASKDVEKVVLLLGAADVAASKKFYVEHGLTVGKSFGRMYVEFATDASPIGLGLYGRKALAKDAGVPMEGTGSHRLAIAGNAGTFTDPDGFAWDAVAS
jgi:hypothetical protein